MEERKRITDKEIFDVIKKVRNTNDVEWQEVLVTILETLVDTRVLLRKLYKNINKSPKIVTDPLKANDGDVVIGDKE